MPAHHPGVSGKQDADTYFYNSSSSGKYRIDFVCGAAIDRIQGAKNTLKKYQQYPSRSSKRKRIYLSEWQLYSTDDCREKLRHDSEGGRVTATWVLCLAGTASYGSGGDITHSFFVDGGDKGRRNQEIDKNNYIDTRTTRMKLTNTDFDFYPRTF